MRSTLRAVSANGDCPLCRVNRERYVPFIVSGNIRPFHHTWETANVRYLNEVYRRPVIDGKHPAVSPRRYGQMRTPKIIASGMSTRPTCAWVVDPIATGVATVLVIPKDGIDGAYLAAVINSTTMQRLYRVLFGSLSLAGGYLRFRAPQFKLLPVPPAGRAEQRVIARLVADCRTAGRRWRSRFSARSTSEWPAFTALSRNVNRTRPKLTQTASVRFTPRSARKGKPRDPYAFPP